MSAAALAAYLETVQRELERGRAASVVCRDALKRLLAAAAPELRLDDNLRRAAAGGPDFVLWRGPQPAAWVFAGAPDDDRAARWRGVLPSVLATDYLTFTWHAHAGARTARAGAMRGGRFERDRDADAVLALLDTAARWTPPPGPSAPAALAALTGVYARALCAPLLDAAAGAAPDPELRGHLAAVRAALLPGLTAEAFAAMYAQAFAYTLLAARLRHRGPARRQPFTRSDVPWNLPPTSPLLRDLFRHFAGRALDERVAWVLDALAAALDRADAAAVLRAFSQRARADDPLTPFHQTFSAHFDPQQPPAGDPLPAPLAGYAVRSADYLLRRRFRQGLGLADVDVSLLDPAVGTGAFLFAALGQVYATMFQQRQLGGWADYVSDYLLPRAVGCETDLGLYALAHLKLSLLLEATGYDFASSQRLNVFLADPLADAPPSLGPGALGAALYAEAQAARPAARGRPVAVVFSSVPAGPGRMTPGVGLAQLVRETYQPSDDSEERGWPPDAYINYLRLAQRQIEQAGSGIAALISAGGYLDDPALTTMRRSLIGAFSDIYLLSLHDPRTAESAPDEPIPDALPGAVLGIFVRRPGWTPGEQAHVRYALLRGRRADKLAWLADNDLTTTAWQDLAPMPPHFTFVPHAMDLRGEYKLGWALADVFAHSAPGFQPLPGVPAVALNREALRRRAAEHAGRSVDDDALIPCLYRPFDRRWLWLDERAVDLTSSLAHWAEHDTPCLLAAPGDAAWPLAWASADPAPADLLSDAGALRVFPLYAFPHADAGSASSPFPPGPDGRRPNLNPAFILTLANRLGMTFVADGRGDLKATFGPEDVFAYAYAVLNAPAYRARYAEFMRADLPRLPVTGSKKLFRALARKGNDLSSLHLLRRADAWPLITGFGGGGPALVDDDYPRFVEIAGERPRLYINRDKYFEGVPRPVWEFRVGERRPLHDWLAARRGLALDWQTLRRFQQAVVAVRDTLALLAELDTLVTTWPLV